jgi:aryl-alcohol dehydrogenase-like predicted oxidoreductase
MITEKIAHQSGTYLLGGDLKIFRLGFGAMRLTGPGVWGGPKNHSDAILVLHRVLDLGINFIDTADSYGPRVSEKLIAEAYYPYPNDLIVATKGGFERPGPNQWTVNGDPKHLRKACEESLKRLKRQTIDLYQLHRIDPHFPLEEQIGVLLDLRQEGKIRHIGLSEVSVDEIKKVRGMVEIASVQNKYNLLERGSESVLDYCTNENIGFIPWFPLATGDLAKHGGPLETIADKLHAHPSQIALAWLLNKSKVVLPIPGTSDIKHLEENTASALLKLTEANMKALDEIGH